MIKELSLSDMLQNALADQAYRWHVPGAQAVLIVNGTTYSAHYGHLKLGDNTMVAPQSRFQMGSSVKMLTSALVLAASDQNLLSLDMPIRTYLPDFRVEDEAASAQITARHLMTHTAGFDGDFFKEFTSGNSAISDYVEACRGLEQISPPGRLHSYSNAGFVVLAHLAERVFQLPWKLALKQVILEPLGMTTFIDSPLQVAKNTIAIGHVQENHGAWQPTDLISSQCLSPAGAGPACSAQDLAKFCLMLLKDGEKDSENKVLQPASVDLMISRQIEGPSSTFASAWGCGMMLFDWSDQTSIFGHDGAVPGQYTYVRLHKQSSSGLILMTNGGDTASFANQMFYDVLGPVINSHPLPPPKTRPTLGTDLQKYTGQFATRSANLHVWAEDDHLILKIVPSAEGEGSVPSVKVDLHAIDEEQFLGHFPNQKRALIQRFIDFDEGGTPQAFNFRGRVFPRQADGTNSQ